MGDLMKLISGEQVDKYIEEFKKRAESTNKEIMLSVEKILEDIKERGDNAVLDYTRKFDCKTMAIENMVVSKEEIEQACEKVDDEFLEALKCAKENIFDFHKKQLQNSWFETKDNGVILGQKIRGLDNVCIYVPGGSAAYPSSVLMNAIPAKVAGVRNIVMVTPPMEDGSINPYILAAADIAGVDKIYKIGGAQAIGAMAFGTETISKVDKIVGPGNIYVAMAKRYVYGYVDIDMIAGPSEILILADDTGDSKYIAADLMSQAEHDEMASSILVTNSVELAGKVNCQLESQIQCLERKEIIKKSIKNNGAIIIVDNLEEAYKVANEIAPEHLEMMVKNPFENLYKVRNAGSIFLGKYSPEPLGDYMAGPNHVLPTSGTARFFSPLSVDDFVKKSSIIYYTENALLGEKDKIIRIAEGEGLTAHANSIKVRF